MVNIPQNIGDKIRYEPDSGLFFFKESAGGRSAGQRTAVAALKGGYRIYFCRRMYLAHRVAWFLMTGKQPPAMIDHKDGNPFNNRWENLRAANNSQNQMNRRVRRGGLKGVTLHNCGRYQASICKNGERHYLGLFPTEAEAHAVYTEKAKELFGEFARFA